MPRILIVKTSSMGDVIHNLPAVTDISQHFPEAIIDWVVEESFAQIPALHPAVRKTIPVAMRRWRKSLADPATRAQMRAFRSSLTDEAYDVVLDAQGLIKSAVITLAARGERRGYDWASAREPLASCFYQRRYRVDRQLHAVERNRGLTAQALGYQMPSANLDYGIAAPSISLAWLPSTPYAVLLHATSRADKLWPEDHWIALGQLLSRSGARCLLPWGNEEERVRAERLAGAIPHASVLRALSLVEAAGMLARAVIVIGVDTGLTHLAAALGANVVAVYVATAPGLTGVYAGKRAVNLGSAGKPPAVAAVWDAALGLLEGSS